MIFEFDTYSKYLSSVLRARQEINSAYSLRAMAKQLGISPATLSDVLAGKKKLSEQTGAKIAQSMKLKGKARRYFSALVSFELTRDETMRTMIVSQLKALNPKLRDHFQISVDRFKLIANWYHTAILEMTLLPSFVMSPENISRSLGIPLKDAKEALGRLLKLELIESIGENRYQKKHARLQTSSSIPNQALRDFHRQTLFLAQESLHSQNPGEKVVGSETVPINIDDLPRASEIIESCFQQILQLSKESAGKNQVYHLGIQFFRLMHGEVPKNETH